jgi:hypothetical protein
MSAPGHAESSAPRPTGNPDWDRIVAATARVVENHPDGMSEDALAAHLATLTFGTEVNTSAAPPTTPNFAASPHEDGDDSGTSRTHTKN